MQRDIIEIDENLCNGCGLCITACHEGALALVDGKARLIKESWCDGLGACLPDCPTGAIRIIKREADAFDEASVPGQAAGASGPAHHTAIQEAASSAGKPAAGQVQDHPLPCGCPGSQARVLGRAAGQARQDSPNKAPGRRAGRFFGRSEPVASDKDEVPVSELTQWPVQIKLVPVRAPYLSQARLLIAADCGAYARASFHQDFIRGRVTLIGCPKLDDGDYADKLAEIFRNNDIKSIMVVRMEVPCCGGLEHAVKRALLSSGKMIPWQVVTLSTEGEIIGD